MLSDYLVLLVYPEEPEGQGYTPASRREFA